MTSHRLSGQALLEMALVAPILVTLLIGFFSVGQILLAHYALRDMAYAGARVAAFTAGDANATHQFVTQMAQQHGMPVTFFNVKASVRCLRNNRPIHDRCRRFDDLRVDVIGDVEIVTIGLLPFRPIIRLETTVQTIVERDQP